MVVRGFLWVVARVPAMRKPLWRAVFELVALYFRRVDFFTFMNYGYCDGTTDEIALQTAADHGNRYPIALYRRIVGSVDLCGKDVLEVASGRGGGAAHIAQHYPARRVVGIDIAASAIRFSRRVHRFGNLTFLRGDAEALPFEPASFDVLLNVESSFCYPSIERFLAEVCRVLRPGGHFLYADIRLAEEVCVLDHAVAGCGLLLVERADITENVALALARDGAHRTATSHRECGWPFRPAFDVFVGVPGTRIPASLAAGRMRYLLFTLRKP